LPVVVVVAILIAVVVVALADIEQTQEFRAVALLLNQHCLSF
jgi:hypothetical protein